MGMSFVYHQVVSMLIPKDPKTVVRSGRCTNLQNPGKTPAKSGKGAKFQNQKNPCQIRKMIGMGLAVVRDEAPEEALVAALEGPLLLSGPIPPPYLSCTRPRTLPILLPAPVSFIQHKTRILTNQHLPLSRHPGIV